MKTKIKMDDKLKELGFSSEIKPNHQDTRKLDNSRGTYSKNIANKGLFIHYDILIFEKNVADEDTYLNIEVNVELYQLAYKFDVVSGLNSFENTERYPLETFSFTIDSNELAYTNGADDEYDGYEWNDFGELSLRGLALAKIIEIEELIYNKIKEA